VVLQFVSSGSVRLAVDLDEGDGSTAVLLHGLAGYRGEWAATAEWLRAAGHRVVAFDGRGHGDSTRRPDDVSREANVADAAAMLRALDGGPHILIGQSLGGHTALLAAAAHPDLVSAVVLLEAGPGEAAPSDGIAKWLASWPVPFSDADAAAGFFGGGSRGEAWAAGLAAEAGGGLVARFDADIIVATIAAHAARPYWTQWESITAPILVVLAGNGYIGADEESRMRRLQPDATIVRLPGLGHDLHLEDPEAVRGVVVPWLARQR
jgi:pimeloyl-ACP methyl ester carboxylesterase